ncbi:MAG: hypothetical protein ABIG88_01330 [Patescibacteria group bacterium]|nr:hypothetical protein [Patescibacteria group bacterium]
MDKNEIIKQIQDLKAITDDLESVIVKLIKIDSDKIIDRHSNHIKNLEVKKLKQEQYQIKRGYRILIKKIKIQFEFLLKKLDIRKKIKIIPEWALDADNIFVICYTQTNEHGDMNYDLSELFDVPKKIKSYLIQLNKYTNKKFKENKKYPQKVPKNTTPLILFDSKTGIGSVNGSKFEFRIGNKPYIFFKELYKNINKPIQRKKALELINLIDLSGTEQAKRLNRFITRLRRELGLNANHLILKHSITLKGVKK